MQAEILLLQETLQAIRNDQVRGEHSVTSFTNRQAAFPSKKHPTLRDYILYHQERSSLLQGLIENEMSRLEVWSSPSSDAGKAAQTSISAVSNGSD